MFVGKPIQLLRKMNWMKETHTGPNDNVYVGETNSRRRESMKCINYD